jgi:hypothetical protein
MRALASFTSSGQVPSVIPPDESVPPLPLVSERPVPVLSERASLPGTRLELVLDSSIPPPDALLRKGK